MCLDFAVFAADQFTHYKAQRLDRAIGVEVTSDDEGLCITRYWSGAYLGFMTLDEITHGQLKESN